MSTEVYDLPVRKQFNRRMIAEGIWILNPYTPHIATGRPYVVIGEERALVIDPTDTVLPVRKYIEECVTDKPLCVANTHSHHDHMDDNYMFDDCEIFMSEFAWGEIQERRALEPAKGMWTQGTPDGKTVVMTKEQYGTYTPTLLKPGDTIDLGNRIVEVLPYIGVHAPSSLIYFDRQTGTLFTGDEIECGQMLVTGQPGSPIRLSVEVLRDNIQTLLDGWGDRIHYICPPHNGSPLHPLFLTYLLENCNRILSGIEGDPDVRSMSFPETAPICKKFMQDPDVFRSEWMGTSIIYNRTRVHRSDIEDK